MKTALYFVNDKEKLLAQQINGFHNLVDHFCIPIWVGGDVLQGRPGPK